MINLHVTIEQRFNQISPNVSYQQSIVRIFDKLEWKNSTLSEIHYQLVSKLIKSCQIVNQTIQVKNISKEILQLEMRPDTWRRLQFDHISFFSDANW
jgi:hypothetical protein